MNKKTTLILGDILAIAILTVIGFATHGELDFSYLLRMGITFLPVLISWFLAATWLDLFDARVISSPQLFWRILLAMLFCARLCCTAPPNPFLRSSLAELMRWVFWLGEVSFFSLHGRLQNKM
jgi:hypothetical protein